MEYVRNAYQKAKEEFLKKKSNEKFEYLYEKLEDLEQEIEDKECDYSCDCDENSDWIEKIKYEQAVFNERMDYSDDNYSSLEKTVDRLKKLTGLDKIIEKEELERQKRTERYLAEKDPKKRMKILFGEE